MKYRVRFTIALYENDIFSLCETPNAFIHAFCHSQIHFHQRGPLKLIKNNVEMFSRCVKFNLYSQGRHATGATKRSIIVYDESEDRLCKE